MSLVISYQGISLKDFGILKEVISQLNKDLYMSGIDFEFNENLELNPFVNEVRAWIESTLTNNEKALFNFLYRVDVNQELIYTNDGLPQENLLKLILNRELQKVVLKKKYSSGSNELNS